MIHRLRLMADSWKEPFAALKRAVLDCPTLGAADTKLLRDCLAALDAALTATNNALQEQEQGLLDQQTSHLFAAGRIESTQMLCNPHTSL